MIANERTQNTMSPQGGARPGAGRKAGSGAGRTVITVSMSLKPDEKQELDRVCAELGVTQSEFLRLALRQAGVLAVLHKEGR